MENHDVLVRKHLFMLIATQIITILKVAKVLNSLLKGNVLWLLREDEILEF